MLLRQQAFRLHLCAAPEQAPEQASEQVLVPVIDLPEVQSSPQSPPPSPPREYSEDNFDVPPDAHLFKC
jgi:hypothetical protein